MSWGKRGMHRRDAITFLWDLPLLPFPPLSLSLLLLHTSSSGNSQGKARKGGSVESKGALTLSLLFFLGKKCSASVGGSVRIMGGRKERASEAARSFPPSLPLFISLRLLSSSSSFVLSLPQPGPLYPRSLARSGCFLLTFSFLFHTRGFWAQAVSLPPSSSLSILPLRCMGIMRRKKLPASSSSSGLSPLPRVVAIREKKA